MKFYLADPTDPILALYESDGRYYPLFAEKYGHEEFIPDGPLTEVTDVKTLAALKKYVTPYESGKPRVYMAGPLFNEGDRYCNARNSDALRSVGYTTFLPQEVVIDKDSGPLVKAACFFMDLKAIRECDVMVANCNGIEIDSGTAAEIGLAYGWQKKTILYKSDVRNYYNETFRLNNFVDGLVDTPLCSSIEEVLAQLENG